MQRQAMRKERSSGERDSAETGVAAASSSPSSSSSFPPFDTESLASQARRTSRLCGVGGPGLSSVLSLLFSHLTSSRADFPFMLPELQRIIADYAQPERTFMGVTADATEAAGWRIQVMDGNELRARLLQPRMEEVIQQGGAAADPTEVQEAREERVAELQSCTLDELIADCSEIAPTATRVAQEMAEAEAEATAEAAAEAAADAAAANAAEAEAEVAAQAATAAVEVVEAQAIAEAEARSEGAYAGLLVTQVHGAPHSQLGHQDHQAPGPAQPPPAPQQHPGHHLEAHLLALYQAEAALHLTFQQAHATASEATHAAINAAEVAHAAQVAAQAAQAQGLEDAAPAARIHPRLPFEYCIELNGADRIYCQHPNAQVRSFMQSKLHEDAKNKEQGGQAATPAARFCELQPYLTLLFQDARQEAELPELPNRLVSLISDFACEPPVYAFPVVFLFLSPSSPTPLLIEREDTLRRRLMRFMPKYQAPGLMMEHQFGAVADVLMKIEDDWKVEFKATRTARTELARAGSGGGQPREESKDANDSSLASASSSACAINTADTQSAKRRKIMQDLWEEQLADEQRGSDFLRLLQSASSVPQFRWLVRGGAFDRCITWAQLAKAKPD